MASREDPHVPAHQSRGQHDFCSIEKCDIMLFLKKVAFLRDYVRVQQSSVVLSFSLFMNRLICASVTRTNQMLFEINLHL